MNPYTVLGVAKNATDADIKSAYRKLVMKYHPDKNPGDKAAEEKFKDVNNAFDILKDPQKRAAYDRFGDAAFAGGNGASAGAGGFGGFNGNPFGNMGGGAFHFDMGGDMSDILREAMRGFGFDMGDMGGRQSGRGRDLLDEAVITLSDAYFGTTHTAKFTVDGKQKVLEVKIPAGVADGARLRLAGQGEAGKNGAPAGDFYVDVHIRPDKRFTRYDKDLLTRADVPFATLALGGKISVETIAGKKLEVKVPAGTQIGGRLRVKGHGMPIQGSGARGQAFGDMYIDISMTVPTKLTEKQKKALAEFGDTKSDKKGWF